MFVKKFYLCILLSCFTILNLHAEDTNFNKIIVGKWHGTREQSTKCQFLAWNSNFTKDGEFKEVCLGGIDNPRKIKRAFKKEKRLREKHEIIEILPNNEVMYQAKIYLGNFEFVENQLYFITLVYNNKDNEVLSNLCLISNQLKLYIK